MEEEEKEEDVWSTVAANTKGRRVLCTQVSCSMKDCDARGYYAVSPTRTLVESGKVTSVLLRARNLSSPWKQSLEGSISLRNNTHFADD